MINIKILYLVHQFFPDTYTGTEKFLLNVASHTKKLGHDVKIITYSFREDKYFEKSLGNIFLKEYDYKGIEVIAFKYKKTPTPKVLYQSLSNHELTNSAEKILLKENPHIIHIAHPMRVSEFTFAAINLKIPYIITLTDFFYMCPKGIFTTDQNYPCYGAKKGGNCKKYCPSIDQDFIKNRYEQGKNILYSAKKVIGPSHFMASMFKNEFQNLDINVINYGTSPEKCKENKKVYTKNSKLTFAYAGSLNHHKGVHILISSFLRAQSNSASLKIYGSGSVENYVNKIEKMAKSSKNIEFCGIYDEALVGDIFQEIDVLIVPSIWHENCPLVIHEALACHIPVIASDVGGITELINNNINGFTFKIGNGNHLRRIIKLLINNPERLNSIKEEIKNMYINTTHDEAQQYLNIYSQITQRR